MRKRRIVMLVVMVMMMVTMWAATAAPVFAQGVGGCDQQPGQTEKSRADTSTPPQFHAGVIHSDNPQSGGSTGFGDRVDECA